jgi:glycosyltransferase involved in cell wall biosynthesis
LALRLDGIYFNTRQDWKSQNFPINQSFKSSDLVIYQSNFNKSLVEKYFGSHHNGVVIHNGTDLSAIERIQPVKNEVLDEFSEVWCCASSWRPHKRLKSNVEYFLEKAPKDACLIILGENPDHRVDDPRILYAGQARWDQCISIYKRSKVFLHLAFLDHCPNVVVDARACGCQIVVASSGGTREIAGKDAVVIKDIDWDFRPIDLYSPPQINFNNVISNTSYDRNIDISEISIQYYNQLKRIAKS